MTKNFTDDNFLQEVIEISKTKPVLVDFYAQWCGPCKLQSSIIDQVAEEMGDKAVVGKINVDEAVKISEEYSIMSIPTLLIFKAGKSVEDFTGLQTKDNLIACLKKHI